MKCDNCGFAIQKGEDWLYGDSYQETHVHASPLCRRLVEAQEKLAVVKKETIEIDANFAIMAKAIELIRSVMHESRCDGNHHDESCEQLRLMLARMPVQAKALLDMVEEIKGIWDTQNPLAPSMDAMYRLQDCLYVLKHGVKREEDPANKS